MNKEDFILITKFLVREASDEEIEKLNRWRSASGTNEESFRQAGKLFELADSSFTTHEFDVDAEWARFNETISKGSTETPVRSIRRPANATVLKIAAGFAILTGLVYALMTITDDDHRQNHEMVTVTASDSMKVVKLPDNTNIWLNKNTTISYPEVFEDSSRIVTLAGEAFFEVEHDPSRPFEVEAGGCVVKVLGTSFKVRSYDNDDEVEVEVESGKVEFESEDGKSKVKLGKKQKGTYKKGSGKIETGSATREIKWWAKEIEKDLNKFLKDVKKEIKNL